MNSDDLINLLQELISLASKQDHNKTNYLLSKFLEKTVLPWKLVFYLCEYCDYKMCSECNFDYNSQELRDDQSYSNLIDFIDSFRTCYCP